MDVPKKHVFPRGILWYASIWPGLYGWPDKGGVGIIGALKILALPNDDKKCVNSTRDN